MNIQARHILPCLAGLALAGTASAATVTIDTTTHYQTIEGFGGGSVYYTGWLPAHPNAQAIYDTMFTGLGLSYIRLGNWNQDSTASLTADSTIIAEGRKRLGSRFKILMSSWGAPGYLKASGLVKGSVQVTKNGTTSDSTLPQSQNTLKKVNGSYVYADFAHWWKRSLARYATKGIVPNVISLQNEPDMNANYEETLFAETQNDSIAGYPQVLKAVHDTLATLANGPKIYGPEVLGIGYGNFQKYANALDKSLVDGYNYHLYHGSTGGAYVDPDGFVSTLTTLTTTYTGKSWMMSEYCPMRSTHPASDMIILAQLMSNLLTKGNVSAYINWELIWGDGGQMVEVDNPWSTKTWSVNPEYHGMRHFSKFTSPGWHRAKATSDDANIRVVLFASPSGDSTTLVALNLNATASTLATGGKLTGTTDVWQSVSGGPYSARLASLATNGTGSIALPAQSVTTVVWKNATTTAIRDASGKRMDAVLQGSGSQRVLHTALSGAGEVTIRDLSGREVARQQIPAGQSSIAMDLPLQAGAYLAEVRQGGEHRTLRFVQP